MNLEKLVSFSNKECARNVPFIRKYARKAVAPISGELAVFRLAKIVTTVRYEISVNVSFLSCAVCSVIAVS